MKHGFKVALVYIVIIGILVIAAAYLYNMTPQKELRYSDVVELFKAEKVSEFRVGEDNTLEMTVRDTLQDGTETAVRYSYKLRSLELFIRDLGDVIDEQREAGIITAYDYPAPVAFPWWASLIPYLVVIILLIVMWVFVMNQATGGKGSKINSVGRARAKLVTADKAKVYFRDVAGADEEKAELEEIVEFLRNPSYFTKLGAKIPHGVLLVGPPGTGKTLIAKAVAGEAGVPFYSISGSDFVEMYVGVGASRVRDLFDTAKKNPAAIIFIDEIDAVGRHRGAGLGGGHDEREQTLNQILVEMDGFGSSDGVIVMAATNRPDILDPALLRPGRFDRQITMNPPDVKGREEILKVHSRNKPFEEDVDLSVIAKTTVGFTGAELANLLNEAALLACRKGKNLIGMTDLEEAMIKVIVGPAKRSRVITEAERKLTAYHEAGHAITTWVRQPESPVHQISIIPSGRAGGYTLSFPKEDQSYMSRRMMENEILTLLGGRVAEAIILGDISTGASNDIQRASQLARSMVTKYGMSDKLGPILYGSETSSDEVFLGRDFNQTKNYSEETASLIDAEVKEIVMAAYRDCEQVLRDNIDRLHFVASYLMKNEIMEEEQFVRAMTEPDVTLEQLRKWWRRSGARARKRTKLSPAIWKSWKSSARKSGPEKKPVTTAAAPPLPSLPSSRSPCSGRTPPARKTRTTKRKTRTARTTDRNGAVAFTPGRREMRRSGQCGRNPQNRTAEKPYGSGKDPRGFFLCGSGGFRKEIGNIRLSFRR